jgi:hypothetical protein
VEPSRRLELLRQRCGALRRVVAILGVLSHTSMRWRVRDPKRVRYRGMHGRESNELQQVAVDSRKERRLLQNRSHQPNLPDLR